MVQSYPSQFSNLRDRHDFMLEVARGRIPGMSHINKFGHNAGVAATLETVWNAGGIYPYMSTADQLEILSDNDEDGGAGTDTGALTMTLIGLDANYADQSETITLNGTSVVTSTKSYLRIFRAIVRTAGSTGWNIGIITIRDQDTDTTRASITSFKNQTLMAVYTVPADKTAYIGSWYGGTPLSKATELELYIRPEGEVSQIKRHMHLIQNLEAETFYVPEVAAEKSDIEIRAMSSAGGGDVSAGFSLVLVDN